MRQVALLRGINVGGRHRLPMAALREVLAGLGASANQTLGQSGNAVWDAPGTGLESGTGLEPARVASALEERFGFAVPVLLFGVGEFRAVLNANPLGRFEPGWLHVVFLASALPAAALDRVSALASGEEQVVAGERALYLLLPRGISASRLGSELLKVQDGVTGTMRTWGTARKLLALAEPGV